MEKERIHPKVFPDYAEIGNEWIVVLKSKETVANQTIRQDAKRNGFYGAGLDETEDGSLFRSQGDYALTEHQGRGKSYGGRGNAENRNLQRISEQCL